MKEPPSEVCEANDFFEVDAGGNLGRSKCWEWRQLSFLVEMVGLKAMHLVGSEGLKCC